jgi:hypothetical protein
LSFVEPRDRQDRGPMAGTPDASLPDTVARNPRTQYDLHHLNENDYHNGVQLHLTTSTGRTGST